MQANVELRSLWQRFFNLDWKFGIFLIILICLPRFYVVMLANETTNYGYVGVTMIIYALTPFIFLNRKGLKTIGLNKPKSYIWLIYALIGGFVFSILLYFLGDLIYKHSFENWYVYIGESYNIPLGINEHDKLILFIAMAFSGMIFSPFGEEFFFRGILHTSFAQSEGKSKAMLIDSTAFALTHICHFGIVFLNNQWCFFVVPTIIWVLGMFLLSLVIHQFRKKSDSLWGAVICHSGFNLGMIYSIFYLL